MSRPALRGARRTRVYDCNYNAGQSYYKPTLDNLDRKLYGRPLLSERFDSPKPTSLFSPTREATTPFNDEQSSSLNNARRRAERVITEDSFFDVRGARVPKSSIGETIREFDDEFKSTINKIRANKKSTNFAGDGDFDDTMDAIKQRRNRAIADFDDAVDSSFKRRGRAAADFDSSYDESAGKSQASSVKKSTYKFTSRREEEAEPIAVTKWTAVSSTSAEDCGAATRAKATKARLDDLETEMFERSEKQLEREKRSQALKKFIANIDADLED